MISRPDGRASVASQGLLCAPLDSPRQGEQPMTGAAERNGAAPSVARRAGGLLDATAATPGVQPPTAAASNIPLTSSSTRTHRPRRQRSRRSRQRTSRSRCDLRCLRRPGLHDRPAAPPPDHDPSRRAHRHDDHHAGLRQPHVLRVRHVHEDTAAALARDPRPTVARLHDPCPDALSVTFRIGSMRMRSDSMSSRNRPRLSPVAAKIRKSSLAWQTNELG